MGTKDQEDERSYVKGTGATAPQPSSASSNLARQQEKIKNPPYRASMLFVAMHGGYGPVSERQTISNYSLSYSCGLTLAVTMCEITGRTVSDDDCPDGSV
ncbi:hypothetical protein GBF38_011292 [Nibea albiflora]|uniref:Uncharacterized protein n=1 Tax=Nibea albiflora TaxID=240163 RepID=A0ACB7EWY6_NIBAL|nr:hypothetical protein GBF38_011292 [Nibea albiflora]